MEAMRALKRQLSDVVYRTILNDARAIEPTGQGGQPGTTPDSSATDSNPDVDASEKSLPEPADSQPPYDVRQAVEAVVPPVIGCAGW